jgi:hypothetical protein
MYQIGSNYFLFLHDGVGITSDKDKFTWTRNSLLVTINFGNFARARKFLLLEGKCPMFRKFQIRTLQSYNGTIILKWEAEDVFMQGQLCEVLFDSQHVYCHLDDGSIHQVEYQRKQLQHFEVLTFGLAGLAAHSLTEGTKHFQVLPLDEVC